MNQEEADKRNAWFYTLTAEEQERIRALSPDERNKAYEAAMGVKAEAARRAVDLHQGSNPFTAQPIMGEYKQAGWDPNAQTSWTPNAQTTWNASYDPNHSYNAYAAHTGKNKIAAGLLALFVGWLGAHKFYLGYTAQGVVMILVSLLTFGLGAVVMVVISFVEGIIYLTRSDYDFYCTYVASKKSWF